MIASVAIASLTLFATALLVVIAALRLAILVVSAWQADRAEQRASSDVEALTKVWDQDFAAVRALAEQAAAEAKDASDRARRAGLGEAIGTRRGR